MDKTWTQFLSCPVGYNYLVKLTMCSKASHLHSSMLRNIYCALFFLVFLWRKKSVHELVKYSLMGSQFLFQSLINWDEWDSFLCQRYVLHWLSLFIERLDCRVKSGYLISWWKDCVRKSLEGIYFFFKSLWIPIP